MNGLLWGAAALAPAAAGLISLGVFHPRVALFGPIRWHGPRDRKAVAVTFDDGPHPEHTPAVAKVLASHGARGTFFCVGRHLEQQPELARALLAQGHELANHTFSHDTKTHLFSAPALTEDLKKCQQQLESLGVKSKWYRPAVGIRNPPVHQAARALGLEVITWADAARDGAHPLTEDKARALGERARPGDILTLHDGVLGRNGSFRGQTVAHLPALLTTLQSRGLAAVTLSDLLR